MCDCVLKTLGQLLKGHWIYIYIFFHHGNEPYNLCAFFCQTQDCTCTSCSSHLQVFILSDTTHCHTGSVCLYANTGCICVDGRAVPTSNANREASCLLAAQPPVTSDKRLFIDFTSWTGPLNSSSSKPLAAGTHLPSTIFVSFNHPPAL